MKNQGGCQCYSNATWKDSILLTPPSSWTVSLPQYPTVQHGDAFNRHCHAATIPATTSMSSPSTLLHTISSTHDKTTNNYIHRGQLFDPTIPNTSVDPYKTTSNYNNHTAATPLVYCFYSPTTGYPYETATSVPNAATALTPPLANDYKQFSAEGNPYWQGYPDGPSPLLRVKMEGCHLPPTTPYSHPSRPNVNYHAMPSDHSINKANPYLVSPRIFKNGKFLPPVTKNCSYLWQFLITLLEDSRYKDIISWIDKKERIFKLRNPTAIAHLWGYHKNNDTMNYEKLSRGLRYYYTKGILAKVPRQRLCYQFLDDTDKIAKSELK